MLTYYIISFFLGENMIYLSDFWLPDQDIEWGYFANERRTCFTTYYPFCIFPKKELEHIEFDNITILYGGNGTGKTTLLNIIAETLKLKRVTDFNKSSFFNDYTTLCDYTVSKKIPKESRIITSDDVFDYILDKRSINSGIDNKREYLFDEYFDKRNSNFKFRTMEDYEELKLVNAARSKSMSKYVKGELVDNQREYSNGESAFIYFTDNIKENALYLLDEPENSLSPKKQIELLHFLEDSARFFGCQFIISTHSPILLSMKNVLIYNLDEVPVTTSKWTELENTRVYFDFFNEHRDEFE